jgi:DNA polymerase-3 subunit delta'
MATKRSQEPQSAQAPVAVVGHEHQRAMLKRLISRKKLPSAMLFAGPPGIGKRLVAEELARSLFCSDKAAPYGGCKDCAQCRQLSTGNCPDYLSVDCLKREEFDLERLRELLRTLSMRPFLGGARIILLNNADHLSVQAANLLLKSLEEPRPDNHFVLVCSNPGMLPPTLLSRCQIWFFDRLKSDELRHILTQQTKSTEELEDLITLADGSLETAASLQQHRESWRILRADLIEIAGGNFLRATQLAGELGKQKETLRENLHLLRIAARQELLACRDLEGSFRWSSCLLDLLSAERLIFERNLGAQYLLNVLLARLAERRSFTRALGGATLLERVTV